MKTFFELKKPTAARAALGMLMIVASTLAAFEKPAFADAGAHGGGAMVCRKKNGEIKKAYLLDLWEEEVLKHHSIDRNQKVALPPDTKIIANPRVTQLLSLVSSNNALIGQDITFGVEIEQKLEKPLSELEAEIFKQTGKKKKLKIPAPLDVDPELEEKGCKVEGVALWSERYNAVLIDEEIKKAMPRFDQDLIPFHEGAFHAAREYWKATDSKGARELVGCLSSQGQNCFQPNDFTPTRTYDAVFSCSSDIADFKILWSTLSEDHYDITSRIVYTRMENQSFPFGRLVVTARFSENYNRLLGSTKIGESLTRIAVATHSKGHGPRNLIEKISNDPCPETDYCFAKPSDVNQFPHMVDKAFYKFGFYDYAPRFEDFGDSIFRVSFTGVKGIPLQSEFRCVRTY